MTPLQLVKQRREINMRIVLLGATGFVGSALLVEALHRGHKVTSLAWKVRYFYCRLPWASALRWLFLF